MRCFADCSKARRSAADWIKRATGFGGGDGANGGSILSSLMRSPAGRVAQLATAYSGMMNVYYNMQGANATYLLCGNLF